MKSLRTLLATATVLCAAATLASAQTTVTTAPVGFVSVTCKANNTDTFLSVPLAHAADYVGTISAAPTLNGAIATVVASGTTSPGWTANQFAGLWYVKFTSGSLNGKFFTITANADNSISFDTAGDTVTAAANGDQFSVTKYWTLGDLFPVATQTTLVQSPSTLLFQRKSSLFIPDTVSSGINLAPTLKFFITSTGWKQDTTGYPDATNQILSPDTYFIVRHPASVTTDTTFTITGSVNADRAVTALATLSGGKQDNYVTVQRPVGVTLSQSGLSTGFVASANNLLFNRRDTLLVFDNSATGINKSAKASYFMVGTSWIQDTTGYPNADAVVLDPGAAVIVRKYQTSGGTTAFWSNDPSY